jgi:hypothetical protein
MVSIHKECLHPFGWFVIGSLAQKFSQVISDVDCRWDHVGGAEKEKHIPLLGEETVKAQFLGWGGRGQLVRLVWRPEKLTEAGLVIEPHLGLSEGDRPNPSGGRSSHWGDGHCLPREARFLVVFDFNARGGRPGSGVDHVFVRSSNRRLSLGQRFIIVGETLDGAELQEIFKVCKNNHETTLIQSMMKHSSTHRNF